MCGHGQLDEAVLKLETLCEMTWMPLPINLYKSFFFGFCRRRCASEAEVMFDDIEADGYFVDKVMYTCMVKEYCKDKYGNGSAALMRLLTWL